MNSTINSIGNSILINNSRFNSPFSIKAIGDRELIVDRLNNQQSFADLAGRLEEGLVEFKVFNLDNVVMSALDSSPKLNYVEKVAVE